MAHKYLHTKYYCITEYLCIAAVNYNTLCLFLDKKSEDVLI